MNLKKLLTIAALTGFSASVATGQGTTPTIVQGDYITNVFGQSNFIKNPNAKLNTKDVTVSSATVTRSTTTPLVATSEFNVTITSANGTVTWDARAFDAGMKNQNCEARFTYRGFQSTSKVQIKQNSNVVAELALTASTDPRIASINFPCGDLSQLTKFVVTDTSTLSGTNEISGIYTGLATNMANVAQAEAIVRVGKTGTQTITSGTEQTLVYDTETLDVYNEYNPTNGVFTAKRAGTLLVNAAVLFDSALWTAGNVHQIAVFNGSNVVCKQRVETEATRVNYMNNEISCQVSVNVGDTVTVSVFQNTGSNILINLSAQWTHLEIYRFPSTSELVVTPERQNVFGGVRINGNGNTNIVVTGSVTKLTTAGAATRITYGKADTTATNDLSVTIKNLPVGSYKVEATGLWIARATASGQVAGCYFSLSDSATAGSPLSGMYQNSVGDATTPSQDNVISSMSGIYVNTSVADRTFFVRSYRSTPAGACLNYTDDNAPVTITVTPLDQPSNSALYVQGPVKAAETGAAIPSGYLGKAEFGGGSGTLAGAVAGNSTVYTISNVTPGVYLTRLYGSAQRAGANTATYYGYTCVLTTNASSANNWFDYLNFPSNTIGSDGGSFTGFGSGGHLPSSLSSAVQIVSVTATTTYYVRCSVESNGSGVTVIAGAEFIRIN